MMKKAVSILLFCLFFLVGLQCVASNKKGVSFAKIEIKDSRTEVSFHQASKQGNNANFSSIEKLHKKKRFSRTNQNATASLSKCNGNNLGIANLSTTKFTPIETLEICKNLSGYNICSSFSHKKRLSIFYSFQAFW